MALVLLMAGCASTPGTGEPSRAETTKAPPKVAEPLTEAQHLQLDEALKRSAVGDLPGAEQRLRQLRGERPDSAVVAARLGWILQQEDRRDPAMAAYRAALALDPAESMAANNLALMLERQGQFTEARDLLQTALARHPDSPQLHFNLAVLAELYLLDLPTALEHYRIYQTLTDERKAQVAGWIADLERRVN
ncbi:tetratricopeptide repeat protein [Marinobacter halodurans]|nr:tetratricopeptide repeat protein [Marinobacter halodurans]